MKTIVVIANGELSPVMLAAREFYEMRKETNVCPNIICLSSRKPFLSWHSDAEKMKDILKFLGISDFRIRTREENSFQDCILYALINNDISDFIWCIPAGMNLLIKRKARCEQIEIDANRFREDFQLSLSKHKKERKKEIRRFGLQLIADKLVGPGDTILGRYLSTDIIWTDGRPTFAMPVPPYGLQ